MWIITAWQCISPDVTVKGFKKCRISSAVDGSDDSMLQNGSEDGDFMSECEEDNDGGDGDSDTDWER